MLISYPFLKSDVTEDDKDSITEAFTGSYPVNGYLEWHNGKHLVAPLDGNAIADVRAIADGIVIYIDKPDDAPSTDPKHAQNYAAYGGQNEWTDKGMVIIEHTTEIGATGTTPTTITYYSVYAHLKSLDKDLPAVGKPIYRKTAIGRAGQIYGDANHLHFEICLDDANIERLLGKNPDNWPKADDEPTQDGRTDAVFGSTYIYLPADTPVQATAPTNHMRSEAAQTLGSAQWVQIEYAGYAKLTSYKLDGSKMGERTDADAEYKLYDEANARHKLLNDSDKANSSPSGWYELLRFGRNLGRGPETTDKDPLPANAAHWRKIITPSGEMWADLNAQGSFKFSDADFPAFLGWDCFGDDKAHDDQRCDSPKLKALLTSTIEDPEQKAKTLKSHERLFAQTRNPSIAPKLRKAICKFPTEFDQGDFTSRYGYIQHEEDFVGNSDAWKNLKAHIEALTKKEFDEAGKYKKAHWHLHPVEFIGVMRKCGWLQANELKRIYKESIYTSAGKDINDIVQRYLVPLNRMARKYGINTSARMSHFLGQSARESYYFLIPREISVAVTTALKNNHISIQSEISGYLQTPPANPNDVSYFQAYQTNASLANNSPGDGLKFRGRGMKQLTGKYNYSEYWVYRGWLQRNSYTPSWWTLGSNKVSPNIPNPQIVGDDPYNALDTAGYYFVWKKIGKPADAGVTQQTSHGVSALINPYESPPSSVRWSETEAAFKILGDKS